MIIIDRFFTALFLVLKDSLQRGIQTDSTDTQTKGVCTVVEK